MSKDNLNRHEQERIVRASYRQYKEAMRAHGMSGEVCGGAGPSNSRLAVSAETPAAGTPIAVERSNGDDSKGAVRGEESWAQ